MVDDVLIIGGGPAGLSAAINIASEGPTVRIVEASDNLGGQARESNAIENYAGFPTGVTGIELMERLVAQCHKFGVKFTCPTRASRIEIGRATLEAGTEIACFNITMDDFDVYNARSVIVSTGLQYRRFKAEGVSAYMNKGVYYGMPPQAIPRGKSNNIFIVGGANSAGQAAERLARDPTNTVTLIIRKTIEAQMSRYLIDRLRSRANVVICENCEVNEITGTKGWISYLSVSGLGVVAADYLFIFIGANPRTLWLPAEILDDKKFVITNPCFETSISGLFAIGDVRAGSIKRIAAAVGEGSSCVPYIHRFLGGK